MSWFTRLKKGIVTTTNEKKEAPDGVWYACKSCKETYPTKDHQENLWVCKNCAHHSRIGAHDYFDIFFDNKKYDVLFENIKSQDLLKFKDLKSYADRLKAADEKAKVTDAVAVGYGKINELPLTIAAMDFTYIGGSMGSVVGERIAKGIDHAIKKKSAFMIISKSGGARMMESAFSLMQMAKVSAKLTQLAKAKLPYLSFLTDPTTGGVTASYAMLGDINFAEPGALIGFAGPRVIKETIKKDLPEGFQRSEFLLEHGFLDFIVSRHDLKQKIGVMIGLFKG